MAETTTPNAEAGSAATGDQRRARRTKTGKVASSRMDKTVVVAVELVSKHRLYGRTIRRTRKFKAHDEANSCQVGDTVIIAESRPISKEKHWTVQKILRRGTGEPIELQGVPE